MWNVFVVIMNLVFSIMAGAICVAVIGSDWWLLTFFIGLVLWNVVIGAILLIVGFIVSVETIGKGN